MFPYERLISIDKSIRIPVYRQIAISFIHAIRNGTFKAGTVLPSSRVLSKRLGVHRKTVVAGYGELESEGWISVVPRKHIVVSEEIPVLKPKKWNEQDEKVAYESLWQVPFRRVASRAEGAEGGFVPDIIIDDGHPDVRLSPIDELLKTYRSFTSKKYAIKNAHIGTEQGTLRLREELVNYLALTRGLNISVDNLLITHGAQMCIYLSAQLLLGRSSKVIVGKPNYPAANMTFAETGAKIVEIDVDEKGMDIDAVERECKRNKIDAVYVIPHHHYPTTVTLSVERRMKLLELSKLYSFAVIEDDYDYDYHYTSAPYLPLASGNHDGNVIYIGSFSKILEPSLRIGFMVAPRNFIDQCTALRKIIDVGGDGYMQNALAALIGNGELKRHLKKAKKCYHVRRDFLDKLLKEKLNSYVSYSLPTGGMSIWIRLNPGLDIRQLVKIADLKIVHWDLDSQAFRFGFASMNDKELIQAVDALKSGLDRISLFDAC